MKILILTQYFPPDITAAAFRLYDTARLLKQAGHEVRIITAIPHKTQVAGEDTAEIDARFTRVRRTRLLPIGHGGMMRYLRHYLSFMTGCLWQGIRERLSGWKPEVIWASSPPLFVGLSGRLLSILFRSPLVLDIRDIWPDSAVGAGQLTHGGRAYRIGRQLERYLYRTAAQITCVAQPMKDYIQQQTTTPITVIYNGVLAEDCPPHSTVPPPVTPNSPRTILYAGNLGRAQQLDLIIRAMAQLRQAKPIDGWRVRLIGSGALEQELRTLIQQLELTDTVLIDPPVARTEAAKELARADILYISLRPDEVFRRTIPSKLFDCLLAARPIIAGIWGEGIEILETTGANHCYQPGDLEGLIHAITTATTDYVTLNQRAPANRELVLGNYTRELGVKQLQQVFEQALAQ